jgi:SAM-dependent methyltransferase
VRDATNNSNNAQADYWTNEGGPSWVRHERRYERMLQPFDDALIGALRPVSGDRILEIGCGFGATSIALAASGATVHGVDIAPPMIDRARERVQGTAANITFDVADAQEGDLGGPYDTIASRFGVMFFADPVRAFTNIASSVRPEGNLAFVCWQSLDRNPWLGLPIEVLQSFTGTLAAAPSPAPGTPNPLALADPVLTEGVLRGSGWTDIEFEPVEPLLSIGGGDGIDGAVELALNGSSVKALLAGDDGTLRSQVVDALTERFAEFTKGDAVLMQSSAWLVTARRS